MAREQTFSIIKPDATRRNITGAVNAMLEEAGLAIVAQKRLRMTREQAEAFYAVHKQRPFFDSLVAFITSGPVVVQVLEGEDAIAKNRQVMGATNPAEAAEGTIRKTFAESRDGGARDSLLLLRYRDRGLASAEVFRDRSVIAIASRALRWRRMFNRAETLFPRGRALALVWSKRDHAPKN